MKLELNNIVDYETDVGGEQMDSGKVSIDTNNLGMLYEMLSKSIYSNPIGSIVRELVSNCFDSHIEQAEILGIEKLEMPVVVKGFYEELDYYIGFEDFGVGMSTERFKGIYLNYMSSTKRDSNEQLGMFGLGSKSPFSYTDIFYVRTRHNQIEYYYMMSKGANGVPEWDLMYSKPTEESNGTLVKFKVDNSKYGTDWRKFQAEIKSQLQYFDDVYVEDFDIENEYQILENRTFKYRVDNPNNQMTILLGKVIYPINWEIIKRPQINIPIGVKFEIGDLVITPNRESIRYNDEVIAVINQKIDDCLEEVKSLNTEGVYETISSLLKARKSKNKTIRLTDDISLPVYEGNYGYDNRNNPIRYPFKIGEGIFKPFYGAPIKLPEANPYFIFKVVGFIQDGIYTPVRLDKVQRNIPHDWHNTYKMCQEFPIYRTNDFKLTRLKAAYINRAVIITKIKTKLSDKVVMLGLNKYKSNSTTIAKSEPLVGDRYNMDYPYNKLKLFKLYRSVIAKEVIENSKSYDSLEIPEDFKQEWNRNNSRARIYSNNEEINALDITNGDETKSLLGMKFIDRGLIIYGGNRDKNTLSAVSLLVNTRINKNNKFFRHKAKSGDVTKKYKFRVLAINQVDFSKMQGENHISLEDFISKSDKNKILIEQATAHYIYRDYSRLDLGFAQSYIPAVKVWKDKLDELINKAGGRYSINDAILNNKFVKELLSRFESEGLLLKEYVDTVKALKEMQQDLRLIKKAAEIATSDDDKREIASYLIKKGYVVDNYYTFKPNAMELVWMQEWKEYAKYTAQVHEMYSSKSYIARNKPIKLCQVNYPNFDLNKSVKISMLSLEMTSKAS